MKVARAVPAGHGGDVEKLKEPGPCILADAPQKQAGKTGLPNTGATKDADKPYDFP